MDFSLRSIALASISLVAVTACGRASTSSTSHSSQFISIDGAEESWAQKIEYRTESGELPSLTLDGVRFDLTDSTAYAINWEAIGMGGITTIGSLSYESTKEIEDEFFTVLGKEVEMVDGKLMWGTEELGAFEAGQVFVVDAAGLRRNP